MIKRIPIRTKLALALFVPILAMFAVSVYEVSQANRQLDGVRQDTDLAGAALGPDSLIRTLQDERNDSAITAVGLRSAAELPTKDLAATRRSVDTAARQFRASLARSGPKAEAVYASALEAFDAETATLRRQFDANKAERNLGNLKLSNTMWEGYSDTIDQFIGANTRLTLAIEDPQLRGSAEMLDAVSRQVDTLGVMVRTGIISSLGGSKLVGTTKNDVIAQINKFQLNKDRITILAQGRYRSKALALADNPAYREAVKLLNTYLVNDKLDTPKLVSAVSRRPTPNLDSVATSAATSLRARSASLIDGAEARRRNFIGLAVGVLLLGGLFMLLAARSVTRPLLSLTRQANDMATNRLPAAVQEILETPLGDDVVIPEVAPVSVKTRDEVREVAAALNSVQSSALDLAVEQALMRRNIADSFVNLGRRTQNLIGRQLDFITELERNETDPAVLDDLFKLDHLATRARRNAESLVVLAGLPTPRTWAAPIAMTDVVRAALSEVQDYQRVEVRPIDDATVPGRSAADLVHLLAELVENGLSFSPPGRPVEVHGRMTRHGYLLAVIDQGIGMPADELAQANERLAGRESYTVAPSRYLGHYVAGSLAQRIGVTVDLSESPTGGITAKINVPSAVLDEVPALPALSTPDTGGADRLAPTTVDPGAMVDGPPPPAPLPVGVAATAVAKATPTTEHGLQKRVRNRPEPVRADAAVLAAADESMTHPVAVVESTADGAPAGPPVTTPNGLRKRVPGDQLAAQPLVLSINRGTGAKPDADAAPPADSAAADSMFSLLTSFETGVRRGHHDLFGRPAADATDRPAADEDDGVPSP